MSVFSFLRRALLPPNKRRELKLFLRVEAVVQAELDHTPWFTPLPGEFETVANAREWARAMNELMALNNEACRATSGEPFSALLGTAVLAHVKSGKTATEIVNLWREGRFSS